MPLPLAKMHTLANNRLINKKDTTHCEVFCMRLRATRCTFSQKCSQPRVEIPRISPGTLSFYEHLITLTCRLRPTPNMTEKI